MASKKRGPLEAALIGAAYDGDAEAVRAALAAGADAKARCDSRLRRTPLMWAASFGHRDCVAALLPLSDVDATSGGQTAAEIARRWGQPETADFVLAYRLAMRELARLSARRPASNAVARSRPASL